MAYALIFIVTSLADQGMGIAGWLLNLTVGVSCYSIAGESVSCLRHIDHMFPGRLPGWLIERLLTFQFSIERNDAGFNRRREDWRGYWREHDPGLGAPVVEGVPLIEVADIPPSCRGRIQDEDDQ